MRWLLVLLHLVAAAVALVFLALALVYVALSAWALWLDQLAGTAFLLVVGVCMGWVAIRALIGLYASFTRWRRRWLAERALPRAKIVTR